MRFPKPLPDLLHEGLAGLVLGERLREADIWRYWPEVVGDAVAKRAQPLRIINGTLTVAVSSSPWMQQLKFLTGVMKEKLNQRLGGDIVKEILLKPGKISHSEADIEEPTPVLKPLSKEQQAFVAEQSAAISDPEIREAFSELMSKSLRNHF